MKLKAYDPSVAKHMSELSMINLYGETCKTAAA